MIIGHIKELIQIVMDENPLFDAGYFLHPTNEKYKGISDHLGNHFYIALDNDSDNFTSERFAESCDLFNITGRIKFVAVFVDCIDYDTVATLLMRQFNRYDIEVTDISIDAEGIYEQETGEKPKKEIYIIRYKAEIKKLININDCYTNSICTDCCNDADYNFEVTRQS